MDKKKALGILLFCILFTLPGNALLEDDKICRLDKSCEFVVQIVNATQIVNESICNITIWNATDDTTFLPETAMINHSMGFHNYTQFFNSTGTFYVRVQCFWGGQTVTRGTDIEVHEMLENAGLIALIPLGIAFFFIYLAQYLKGKEYVHLRTFFLLMAITFVWGSLSAGMEIARADAYTNLQLYLRSLWFGYTAFMVAFWGIYMFTIVLPKTLEWFRQNMMGKKRGLKW